MEIFDVKYSVKLDLMTEYISRFLQHTTDQLILTRTHRAIEDFCYGYPESFRDSFLDKVGIDIKDFSPILLSSNHSLENEFVDKLVQIGGGAIFLLKDTQNFFDLYKKKTGKGLGVKISREFIGGEDVYFDLINCTYKSIEGANDFETFIKKYINNFKILTSSNNHLKDKTIQIFDTIKDTSSILWIDVGFQFTINLFCYASVELNSNGKVHQDFYNFTVCPWLTETFNGKYFTQHNELGFEIEKKAEAADNHFDREGSDLIQKK